MKELDADAVDDFDEVTEAVNVFVGGPEKDAVDEDDTEGVTLPEADPDAVAVGDFEGTGFTDLVAVCVLVFEEDAVAVCDLDQRGVTVT